MMSSKNVFLIAGEASGDVLGGPLMEALRVTDPDVQFAGVGGEQMKKAGLQSLMPMEELCVMGVFEVLEHLPRLLRLIKAVVVEIEAVNPDVVVMIDLPDFNFRVAKLLKKRGKCDAKLVHYVAPTVWAWRPGRAKKISKFLDGLMCLFPFEPEYFTPHGLKAEYVGHPLASRALNTESGKAFRAANSIADDVKLVTVMLGSRKSEFKVHAPIFAQAIKYIQEQEPNVQFVMPTLPHLHFEVLEVMSQLSVPSYVLLEDEAKWAGVMASDAAMAVSGTAALELAYAGLPHVVAYKAGFATWVLLKLLVKSKFAHLANIILGRDTAIVPELLQFNCTPEKIARGVLTVLRDDAVADVQRIAFEEVRAQLSTGDVTASERAARFVLSV